VRVVVKVGRRRDERRDRTRFLAVCELIGPIALVVPCLGDGLRGSESMDESKRGKGA